MFTHINGYLNRVEYLKFTYLNVFLSRSKNIDVFQASLIISTNDVKLRIRQYREYIDYVYTHASAAMPTTQRTNDYTTPSLALTNGSTFGDFYYYYEGI